MGERLQKLLARAGIASRRASEVLIREGRVTVNGRQATIGMSADPATDEIRVDGVRLSEPETAVIIALNKPSGVVSTSRSQRGAPTVVDLVALPQRVFPVGRLDKQSEGLILLTNDGALANRLAHPRYEHEKEYRVLLDHAPDRAQLEAWRRGVTLRDGSRTLPANITYEGSSAGPTWVKVVLRQGLKRQIRLSAQALGLNVRRLIRTKFAGIELGELKSGAWRKLSPREIAALRRDRAVRPGTKGG